VAVDEQRAVRVRRMLTGAATGWHAPEQAAVDTAAILGLTTVEAAALAAWWGPDDGPLDAVMARVGDWLDAVDSEPGRRVVVASPAVVRALVVHALGADATVFWRLDVAVWSVTVLTRAAAQWRVRSISDG